MALLLGFLWGCAVRVLLFPTLLESINFLGPWSLACLPGGFLLRGYCCLSLSLLMAHSLFLLTFASGLSFCDSFGPPATAEVISPQETAERLKGWASEIVWIWGFGEPSLIYIGALLESFPRDIFRRLLEASTALLLFKVAISES